MIESIHKIEYQKELDNQGFFILDLLSEHELITALNIYQKYESTLQKQNSIHISDMQPLNQKKELLSEIKSFLSIILSKHFVNFKLFWPSFIIKYQSTSEGVFEFHQDLSVVNEQQGELSCLVWLALQNTNFNNGGIFVIPGSHRTNFGPRYLPNKHYKSPYKKITNSLNSIAKEIDLKAGQAIVWNHQLLHGSFFNYVKEPRIIMAIGITNLFSQHRLWVKSHENQLIEISFKDDVFEDIDLDRFDDIFENSKITLGGLVETISPINYQEVELSQLIYSNTLANNKDIT